MATREQRALAAQQRTGPGITFLDRNQRAFADDEAMLIAGVDGDDEPVAGVGNDEDYDYNYEQPGYDMDVNPYNKPDAAKAPEPDAAEALEAAEAPHHQEHDAAEAPKLDAVEAPHYDKLDAAEAVHDELDDVSIEAPFEQPMNDAEAPVPEATQYEPDDAAQLELDAAMDKVRTREASNLRTPQCYKGCITHGPGRRGPERQPGQHWQPWNHHHGNSCGRLNGRRWAWQRRIRTRGNPSKQRRGFLPWQTDEAADAAEAAVLGFIFAQVSMKKGLKLYGNKGEAAVEEELQQLHNRKVMEPVAADSLTYAEKKKALEYLMFLKEKRTGKIKGCGCADGRKQWVYTANKRIACRLFRSSPSC
jgi:hypothetical protein